MPKMISITIEIVITHLKFRSTKRKRHLTHINEPAAPPLQKKQLPLAITFTTKDQID